MTPAKARALLRRNGILDEVDIIVEKYGIHMIGRQPKGDMRWMAGAPGTPGVSYGDTLTHAVHTYIIESVLGETNE